MSIASSLEALAQAKADIADAIVAQGGTVGEGDGFADFATDIATIATGFKVETDVQEKTSNVDALVYTPQDITEVLGAVLFYKPLSESENTRYGMIENVRIGNVQWGVYRRYIEASVIPTYVGTNYGSVQFPTEYNPSVIFQTPASVPSGDLHAYKAGSYQIIVWGN